MLNRERNFEISRKQNEDLIRELRNKIRSLEIEIDTLKSSNESHEVKFLFQKTIELELKEKFEATELDIIFMKGVIDGLERRCEELSQEYDAERKKRLNYFIFFQILKDIIL